MANIESRAAAEPGHSQITELLRQLLTEGRAPRFHLSRLAVWLPTAVMRWSSRFLPYALPLPLPRMTHWVAVADDLLQQQIRSVRTRLPVRSCLCRNRSTRFHSGADQIRVVGAGGPGAVKAKALP